MELELGTYLVLDEKSLGAWASKHGVRIIRLSEKNIVTPPYVQPAYRARGMSFPDFKSTSRWVKKHKEPARIVTESASLTLNNVRIPPFAAQEFFKETDASIEALKQQIEEVRRRQITYAKEHLLEWSIAEVEDFPQTILREPSIQK